MVLDILKIDLERQVMALFDSYLHLFNKSGKKINIHVVFVISAILASL